MPSPNPIYKRGRKTNITPLTEKLKDWIMNGKLDKLKSRKLWVTVFGAALVALGQEFGFSQETMNGIVAVIAAYVIGEGIADNGRGRGALIAFGLGLCLMTSTADAGVDLDDPKAIVLPEVPTVENPNWLERGSIWSFVWGDFSNDETGAGVRLGYEITDHIRIRFDYMVEAFSFDEGAFADQSEATLSMRYELAKGNNFYPYLIAGGGSASLATFEWEYLIGGGVDYEFQGGGYLDGVTAFIEFLHIRTESDDFNDRNEVRIGAGIPLDRIGGLITQKK